MRIGTGIAAVAVIVGLVAGLMASGSAWAWGVPGCINLPEYERALGALQGMTSACDMSVERAREIVAAHGNTPGGLFGRLLGTRPPPVPEAIPVPREPESQAVRIRRRARHDAARR